MSSIKLDGITLASTANSKAVLDNAVVLPAGSVIKTSQYVIARSNGYGTGSITTGGGAFDDSRPQITEGVEIFSQSYTPGSGASKILIRTHFFMFETSNVADACGAALFLSGTSNAIQLILDSKNENSSGNHAGSMFAETIVDSWTGTKTISIRKLTGHQSIGYWHSGGHHTYAALFDGSSTNSATNPFGRVIVQEIS